MASSGHRLLGLKVALLDQGVLETLLVVHHGRGLNEVIQRLHLHVVGHVHLNGHLHVGMEVVLVEGVSKRVGVVVVVHLSELRREGRGDAHWLRLELQVLHPELHDVHDLLLRLLAVHRQPCDGQRPQTVPRTYLRRDEHVGSRSLVNRLYRLTVLPYHQPHCAYSCTHVVRDLEVHRYLRLNLALA